MKLASIYTEKNNCQDCYKCVRECPVKAIKIEDNSASIIPELCIFCGHCTVICPVGAKKIRDDVDIVKMFLKEGAEVIVSLAPSYISEFPNVSESQLIGAIKKLGFRKVSETALGAEVVSSKIKTYLSENNVSIAISGCCPSVVELINKYYPQYVKNLLPFLSPMLSHGKMLKEASGKEVKVVFVGPCVAKKLEKESHPEYIDAVITFQKLKEWFASEGIDIAKQHPDKENKFFPTTAHSGCLYPIDGGMISGIKQNVDITDAAFMSFSGTKNVMDALSGLGDWKNEGTLFLELLACEEGCINGPGSTSALSNINKRYLTIAKKQKNSVVKPPFEYDKQISYVYKQSVVEKQSQYSEDDIISTLNSIGKLSVKDELNCGGCGYESCRNFAVALLDGIAERSMCVSYMRNVANNKANILLRKMPYGVVILDENLKVIESNKNFANLLGDEIEDVYECNPGLKGADLRKLVPFHNYFTTILNSGMEALEKDIRKGDSLLHLSVFTIQPHKIVCGILQNLKNPEIQKDEVISRTRKVIKDNLYTVQKIAFLLGENASNTEAILNSIVEIHNNGGE
ncbi:MAG: [Fe-Fe] hydrogenase large subunit C-terminal domain-containing protein [Bacteroidota bacterium]|nr:[Fe-Fe] hydrogenase large subunit C-terminal domain-containing protein [Bacteroidota bacterium]